VDRPQSYKHLPSTGAFSYKFSVALAAKLLSGSEKLARGKNGTDLLYHGDKLGAVRRSYDAPLTKDHKNCSRDSTLMDKFISKILILTILGI